MDNFHSDKPNNAVVEKMLYQRIVQDRYNPTIRRHGWLVVVLCAMLSACGGGGDDEAAASSDVANDGSNLGVGGQPVAGEAFFHNGSSMTTPESHWVCFLPENIGSGEYWTVAFYRDATGRYVGADAQQNISWTYNDPDVSFDLETQTGPYALSGVQRVTASEFDATISRNGGAGEMRKCLRYDNLGNRI